MYTEIQELKKLGFKKRQIARKLLISRPTVIKYFNMAQQEFEKSIQAQQTREKKTVPFVEEVVDMLREHPDYASAQIFDRLLEKHLNLSFSESTLRSAVQEIRKKYDIPKIKVMRQFEEIEQLPMGMQMQVDFGVAKVITDTKKSIKIYAIAFVMAHSRHKYCQWQTRPFTTIDTIIAHENAFEYYGGLPQEVVYDQDHLILVNENGGDLIYTAEFAKYRNTRDFKVYMCRKADPQSKGKVENVVKYIKYNFAKHRIFFSIDKWNEDCLGWLARRGNGKVHETTKKIPADVFKEEQKHLKPIGPPLSYTKNNAREFQVRKNNTVPIEGNRYSVPIGTYKGPETYVKVEKTESEIIIRDIETDEELNRQPKPTSKGNLFKNNNHGRDTGTKVAALIDELLLYFSDCQAAKSYFEKIKAQKPRYVRDQLMMIKSSIKGVPSPILDRALKYCQNNQLYNASDFKDVIKVFNRPIEGTMIPVPSSGLQYANEEISRKLNIKPMVRDMDVYRAILSNQTH